MAVQVRGGEDKLYAKANFFRVDLQGNLALFLDAGGLDVSKVAIVAAGNWTTVELLEEEGA